MVEKKKKSTRWACRREEISKEADPERKYLCVIPTSDGEAFLGVLVYPDKVYGTETGRQIIAKYLSRNWRKGELAKTDAKRQSDFRNEPKYGNNRTQGDWERVERLGNEKDDYTFREHQKKLQELKGNAKGKRTYLRELNEMKQKLRFDVGNQALMPSEKSPKKREDRDGDDDYDPTAMPEDGGEDDYAQEEE